MLDNPEETEPLLPGSPEGDDEKSSSQKSAQERHEQFKKEIQGAQSHLENAEAHQQNTLEEMKKSKNVFKRVSARLVELDEELEKNDSLMSSLMRKAICNQICLWVTIVCLVVGNLLVVFFMYIQPSAHGKGGSTSSIQTKAGSR